VIGILAEFDALPGLAQQATPEKMPVEGKSAGHGCGHNLFGTASVAAGIELKQLIAEKKLSGTIRVYGCPAEEGGSGKVYMVRAGLFNDVDVVIHWHPGDGNSVTLTSALANKSAKFRFHGLAAHAAAAPDKGRSALDGVESMDYMVNMMREHIPQETRIHYVITNGGLGGERCAGSRYGHPNNGRLRGDRRHARSVAQQDTGRSDAKESAAGWRGQL
jgi:aminobenzoyl-glutamate utilization protein B